MTVAHRLAGLSGSGFRFGFLDAQEVEVAAFVSGDDQLAIVGDGTASAALSQVNVARTSPVSRHQTFTVLSSDAETAACPSGVTATA